MRSVKPIDLVRRVNRPANHLYGRPYFRAEGSARQAATASFNVAKSVCLPAPSLSDAGRAASTKILSVSSVIATHTGSRIVGSARKYVMPFALASASRIAAAGGSDKLAPLSRGTLKSTTLFSRQRSKVLSGDLMSHIIAEACTSLKLRAGPSPQCFDFLGGTTLPSKFSYAEPSSHCILKIHARSDRWFCEHA